MHLQQFHGSAGSCLSSLSVPQPRSSSRLPAQHHGSSQVCPPGPGPGPSCCGRTGIAGEGVLLAQPPQLPTHTLRSPIPSSHAALLCHQLPPPTPLSPTAPQGTPETPTPPPCLDGGSPPSPRDSWLQHMRLLVGSIGKRPVPPELLLSAPFHLYRHRFL